MVKRRKRANMTTRTSSKQSKRVMHCLKTMKINYWSKVIDGRYDFFQEFLRAETDVLDIDTKDKQAL
jgi:hypothetical protein